MTGSPLAAVVADARRALELQWAAEEQRELELTEAEKWARDPLGWINTFVWIASPFASDVEIPATVGGWLRFKRRLRAVRMRLYPAQEATIRAWLDLDHLQATGELVFRNLADEKSRQIGETWVFAALLCWALHHHRITALAMHVDAGEIDDGGARNTTKSLFGKIRYIDQRLDRQTLTVQPLSFRPFSRELAKVENPANGAVVYGEGQTDDPGRGGTFDAVLVDEAAFVRHGEKVYAAIDEACPNGKALNSTVNGDDTFHARICDERPAGYTVLRLHWSEHPIYRRGLHVAAVDPAAQPDAEMREAAAACPLCAGNRAGIPWSAQEPRSHRYPGKLSSPWYEWRVIGKTDEQVANELDIDRERALGGRVYREFSTAIHVVDAGIEIELDDLGRPLVPFELAFDFGLDATSVPVIQNAPHEVRVIGLLEMGDLFGSTATPERVSEELRLYLQELGLLAAEAAPAHTRHLRAVGDPAGHSRDQSSGRPVVAQYRRQGFNVQKPPARLTRHADLSIIAVKRLLAGTPKPLRICGVRAAEFAAHMRNNVWPTDKITGRRLLGSTVPLDNVHNHACRAFAYWAVATFPPPDERLNYPPTSGDETPPALSPLAERRRRQARRAVAGGDLDDALPFADGGSL